MDRIIKLLAAALMLTFAQVAHAQAPTWVVSEAAGKVVVRDASGDHPAKRGMTVPIGGTLSTGPGSRAVMVHGKDFATVAANSRVRVPNDQQTQGGRFALIQEFGNVVFQIEKLPQPHFGVRTPYLAAVVKGTTFSITVMPEGASLQVLEGAVQTSTLDDGASEIIRPGITATVSASDRFRLTVQGQDSRTIDSPTRSQPPAPGAPPPEQAVPNADDTASTSGSTEAIAEVIAANPTDLGKTTDGLVGGTIQIASADVALVRANGSGSGNAQGNDNKSASNAGSSNSSNGNANGSTNGNGGSSGKSGSDEGSTSGNGNSGNGSSGNGNGNAGTGNSGNGNGNSGTGNSGNGNGNSGTGNSGNGNGNSGTGNSGNGNGNSGTGNAGNGNGNSGTGNSGNGNGNSGTGNSGNGNGNSGTDNSGNGNGNSGTGNSGNGNGNSGTDNSGTGNGNSGNGNSGNGNGNAGNGNSDNGNGNAGNGNGNSGNGNSGNGNGNDSGSGNGGNGKVKP